MTKIKYYYDTETCRYTKAKVKKSDLLFNAFGFLAFTILLALGLAMAYNTYYMTPAEVKLKKENTELKKHYKVLESKVAEVDEIVNALQYRDDEIYRKIYEAEPLSASIREAGTGGSEKYSAIINKGFADRKIVAGLFDNINKLKAQATIQNQSYTELMHLNRENILLNLPSIQPVQNNELDKLTSGYGMRIHPIHKGRYQHKGVDFAAPRGTPVYATADGEVKLAKASDDQTGYGNQIEIDHNNDYITKYAHLEKMMVKKGDKVSRGQIIGLVGNSGGSVAPHLHYEVMRKGEKINPVFYMLLGLNEDQYHQLLTLSSRENQSLD